MANHKSAVKRARQSETRRLRNKSVRTRVKNVTSDLRSAAGDGSKESVLEKLKDAASTLDVAAKKGVVHRNTAARRISRLSKLVNSISA